MEFKRKFNKKQILFAALAAALAYSLFGFGGLVVVGLYYAWKWI